MNSPRVRSVCLRSSALVLMTLLLGGWYQANAPSPSDVPAPTIRVNTRLVLVDVVVTDKQGKPVPALSRDAFAVEEGGKPQKISVFETPQASQLPQAPALPPASTRIARSFARRAARSSCCCSTQ